LGGILEIISLLTGRDGTFKERRHQQTVYHSKPEKRAEIKQKTLKKRNLQADNVLPIGSNRALRTVSKNAAASAGSVAAAIGGCCASSVSAWIAGRKPSACVNWALQKSLRNNGW
jgi:hypothetical protein